MQHLNSAKRVRIMKFLYHSYFRGWVEITVEQKEKLTMHMRNGITGISKDKKEAYINSRFKEVV